MKLILSFGAILASLAMMAPAQELVTPGALSAAKGFFYRSDQFSFAKMGVPASYFDPGIEYVGQPAGWGREQQADYEDKHYHQVSDELRDWWNLDGAVEDFQLCFFLGVDVANQPRMPVWNRGDEFEATRQKVMADAEARR